MGRPRKSAVKIIYIHQNSDTNLAQLERHLISLAFVLAFDKAGNSRPAKIEIIAITTNSSTG